MKRLEEKEKYVSPSCLDLLRPCIHAPVYSHHALHRNEILTLRRDCVTC